MLSQPQWPTQGLYDGIEMIQRAFERFYRDNVDEFERGNFVEGEMKLDGDHFQFRAVQDPKNFGHYLVNFESWRVEKEPGVYPDAMGHFMYSGDADMIKRIHIHDL